MPWLKIETHTPDKPEIFDMSRRLGIHPDEVFGKCFRLWAWMDAHTTNGKTNGCGVSDLLVDHVCGVKGFAEALISVGWLDGEKHNLSITNFDRHNGDTAKTRALTANRVAKHANAKLTEKLTVDALPREDKRRIVNIDVSTVRFETFWKAYPKKAAKPKALSEWKSAKINGEFDSVLAALEAQKRSDAWLAENGKYIPHPAKWIKEQRWLDCSSLVNSDSLFAGAV